MSLGVTKEFDPKLAEWATRAERELENWLRKSGYRVNQMPHGQCGVDLHCESDIENFFAEIERQQFERWSGDSFRYTEINVLERRRRYDRTVLLFGVREDWRFAYVVFPGSLMSHRLTASSNKFVKAGEYVFKVPILEALRVDLSAPLPKPLAVMNANRVRDSFANAKSRNAKRAVLGEVCPFGMSDDEYRELVLESEKEIKAAAFRGHSHLGPQTYRRVPDIYGRSGWHSYECSICGEWIGCSPDEKK